MVWDYRDEDGTMEMEICHDCTQREGRFVFHYLGESCDSTGWQQREGESCT